MDVLDRSAIILAAPRAPATVAQRKPAPVQSFKVIATFPHDTTSFTQGLVFASDGQLYESTGLHGESTLRRVDITTGKTLQRIDVPSQYFAEGLALVGDELLQLTWQHKLGFVYDRKTFTQKRTFPYKAKAGASPTTAAVELVMSDGSDTLTFLDPKTFAPRGPPRARRRTADCEPERARMDRRRDLGQRVDDRSHRADLAEDRRGQRVDRFVDAVAASQRQPPGRRAERHRLRQGHAPDLHHRQEVAAPVSDRCVLPLSARESTTR